MRQEVLEARAFIRQVVAIGSHGYIILNTSTRGKRIRVILYFTRNNKITKHIYSGERKTLLT